MTEKNQANPDVTGQLAAYISQSGSATLPPAVVEKAKHHILDSLAAIIFGSSLKPGRLAIKLVHSQCGVEEAQVIGTSIKTTAINASLANVTMGHAVEVDDYQPTSLTHAGIAVVPAALALAEKEKVNGMRFLKGVVAGYDLACRITPAMGLDNFARLGLASHSVSGTFGAAAAAASIMKLSALEVRYVLSYAVQQASGSLNWLRDYETAMSHERLKDPTIMELKKRIHLFHEPRLDELQFKRQAIIEVTTSDGAKYSEHVQAVRGTPANPMTREEVAAKALDLTWDVLGKEQSLKLIEKIWHLEEVNDMRELGPLLTQK